VFRRTPARYSHQLIQEWLTDYLGVVTGREEDRIEIAGLKLTPATKVKTPLLADCPVNIECAVEHTLDLDSHTFFIGQHRTGACGSSGGVPFK
jgi:flavin reductase (DIM6/NTAB) family NADH-FMN oxidoreductase RutF